MKRIRILIVDGSSTTRQAQRRLLDRDLELEVVRATPEDRVALVTLQEVHPDVVLPDIAMRRWRD